MNSDMDAYPDWTRPDPPASPVAGPEHPTVPLAATFAAAGPPPATEPAPALLARGDRPSRATLVAGAALGVVGLLVGGTLGSRLHASQTEPTSAGAPPAAVAPPWAQTPGAPLVPSARPRGDTSTTTPAAAAIAAKVTPAVVDVYTQLGTSGAGAGTGMILTSDGEVLTNNHVVEGATSIRVVLVTTGRSYTAKVLGTDSTDDVALIKLTNASGLPTIRPSTLTVRIGSAVVAIGNAGGVGGAPSVVTGKVTGLQESITVRDEAGGAPSRLQGLIETNAPIRPGDSGGPLVNSAAEVIGMDTAASSRNAVDPAAATAYAVPIDSVLAIARQIEAGRGSATVRIGVPGLLGVSLGADGTTVVRAVTPGSPAEVAGLNAGDTIRSIGGHSVSTADGVREQVRAHRPGERVEVRWVDSVGSSHRATVRLAEGPPD